MSDKPAPAVARALTNAGAWASAGPELRTACLPHIDDAQRQVVEASDKAQRQAMLARLPPHIRGLVQERLKALWCAGTAPGWGRVIYATDNSDDGYHDACVFLGRYGDVVQIDAIRRLPDNGAIWVVVSEKEESPG